MPVATTTAVLGAAALGAGASAYGSYQNSRSARDQANAQRDYMNSLLGPMRDIAGTQRDAYQQYYPQNLESIQNLSSQVYEPNYRAYGARVMEGLDQPYGLPQEVSDRLFQQSRARSSALYNPQRQAMSERLAGAGALDSGASINAFNRLDEQQLRDLEDQAFQQTLAEIDLERTGRQQATTNLRDFFGVNPATNMPLSQLDTNAITQLPSAGQGMYVPQPQVGVNWGDVAQGAYQGAQFGAGFGGGIPTQYGQAGYHGAGYANYPLAYLSQYGVGGN
jgi:hypothetical protein